MGPLDLPRVLRGSPAGSGREGIYPSATSVVWHLLQVTSRPDPRAARTLAGRSHWQIQRTIRDPEPVPRDVPPRVPMPALHGRGSVTRRPDP